MLHPSYRRVPERLGTFLSYVRFLFIKMHREWFRDEVLAELLPPLEKDGTSHLWDAIGHHFTGMTYAEADKLSRRNKEFVRGLFPEGAIYASLLPKDAQAVIGKVGLQTRGVEKLLRRIGFRYAHRVDPFDGGPHFTALTDEVSLVSASRHLKIAQLLAPADLAALPAEKRKRAVVAMEPNGPPFFRALLAAYEERPGDTCAIGADAAESLGLGVGDEAWVLPLE